MLEVRKSGDELGVILLAELLDCLQLGAGDALQLVGRADWSVTFSSHDPMRAEALRIARQAFRDHGETYRELAK